MEASTDATNCAPGINTKDSPENEVNRQNPTKVHHPTQTFRRIMDVYTK